MDVAVVPVPDTIRGEEVKAYILPTDGNSAQTVPPEEIIAFCESRLARFAEMISLAILAIMTGVSSLVNLGENAGNSRFIVCANRSDCWQRSATDRVR